MVTLRGGGRGEAGSGQRGAAAGRDELERIALDALEAALEALEAPAFLVRAPDVVLQANARGAALLARERERVLAALRQREVEPARGPARHPLRTAGHFLAVFAGEGAEARAAAVGGRWGLTPRQTAVLALVAEGESNRAVAARLGCSEKAVELHVSTTLGKAGCASRSQRIARSWNAPPAPPPGHGRPG